MMKKKHYFSASAAAMLIATMASCSESDIATTEPGTAGSGETCYVSVAISSDGPLGRANDPTYEYGTEAESAIRDLWFVGYDANGNVVGKPVNATVVVDKNEGTPTPSVGYIGSAVVPFEVTKGSAALTQIVCYVNPIQIQTLDRPLSVVETATRTMVSKTVNGQQSFAMANSVFFNNDGTLQIAVPVKQAIFNTEADAQQALTEGNPDKVAQIFVERAASKVKVYRDDEFTVSDFTSSASAAGVEDAVPAYTMTFVPAKWDVNCRGEEGFVLKCFRSQNSIGSLSGTNATYSDVEKVLGANNSSTNWLWNLGLIYNGTEYLANEGHRSFWGCSPAYYSTAYPTVVSDMMNMETNAPTANAGDYRLKYLRFDEVANDFPAANGVANANAAYYLETTTGELGIHDSDNPNASVPSVIVTGSYRLTADGMTAPDGTTFYAYFHVGMEHPFILFENKTNSLDAIDGLPTGSRSLLDYLAHHKQQTVFAYNAATKEVRNLTKDEIARYFEVARPINNVLKAMTDGGSGDFKLAARKFTIQLKSAAVTAGVDLGNGFNLAYIDSGKGYQTVSATNINAANALVAKDAGFADIYGDGKAYFNIPIRHYGWYRPNNKNAESNAGIDWNEVKVGDFGMVRNHAYSIGISSIKGLGTGVNPDFPIIPPADETKQFIAYKLRVLNWAVVPVQNVEL